MKPVNFKTSNLVLGKPPSMTEEECEPLPVFKGHKEFISCWELTDEEIEALRNDPRVWVWVYSDVFHPPIALSGINPFPKELGLGDKIESDKPGQENDHV